MVPALCRVEEIVRAFLSMSGSSGRIFAGGVVLAGTIAK
jgi:hypothetical protein